MEFIVLEYETMCYTIIQMCQNIIQKGQVMI